MSRSNISLYEEKTIYNQPSKYDKRKRVLLIDGDSILYSANYKSEDDIEKCKYKIHNKIQQITLAVEQSYNIIQTTIFVGGDNNFRYEIYPKYKSNRDGKHENIAILHKYMVEELGAIKSVYGEADDSIYTAVLMARGYCVVASNDKDLKSFIYGCPIYNYQTSEKYIGGYDILTKDETIHNFVCQLMTGDSGDGVNLSPGIGPKYCEEAIYEGMSVYEYSKQLLLAYIKAWKGDIKKAKDKIRLCYKLLKLYDIREINLENQLK